MLKTVLLPSPACSFFPSSPLADTWEDQQRDRHVLRLNIDAHIELFPDFTPENPISQFSTRCRAPEVIKTGSGSSSRTTNPKFDRLSMSRRVSPRTGRNASTTIKSKTKPLGDNAVYDDTHVVTPHCPD